MNLEEFVRNVLAENNIEADVEEIIKNISNIAKQRAVNGVAAISDDEVRQMVLNNANLVNQLAEERKAKEEEKKAVEEARKAEEEAKKIEKALEEERKAAQGEQTALF